MTTLKSQKLIGLEIEKVLLELAQLRIRLFFEFPYLYQGNIEYEKKYLSRYLNSSRSFFFGLWDQDQLIGATTGLPLSDEETDFKNTFHQAQLPIEKIYYFGESLLLPQYRGQKWGHVFFDVREDFAIRENDFQTTCFCSVLRPDNHPLRPVDYRSHHQFWTQRGYSPKKQMITQLSWQDRNETVESNKFLEFWIKDWKNEI